MEGAQGSSEGCLIENINVREEARQSVVAWWRSRRPGNTNERSLSSLCFTVSRLGRRVEETREEGEVREGR